MEHAQSGKPDSLIPALLFRVQSRLCALPIEHVIETMRPLPVEPLAGAPAAVKGMSLIRGVPVPVVALAALLDDGDQHPSRFITVRTGTEQIALTVDAVLGVHHIAAASMQDLPLLLRDADNSAVSAIGATDAELLLVLNAARLVPDGLWRVLNTDGADIS
jgi:purine-binding chemotaxis protein CheW